MDGSSFQTPLDIARRACQHLGERMITSFTDLDAPASIEFNESYSRLREFELERNAWRFSIRRAVVRPITTTSFLWTPPTYSNVATYSAGAIVAFTPTILPGTDTAVPLYWQSDVAVVSRGSNPDVATTWHKYAGPIAGDVWSTSNGNYYAGEIVSNAGVFYLSLISGNADTPPTANWLVLNGTTTPLTLFYPIGTGPVTDGLTSNVLRLPYGFRRSAPRYLFDNSTPMLGADIGPYYDDWVLEGNYAITNFAGPQVMRFGADVADVFDMHAMFCEGLAAFMAYEGCERITGSTDKQQKALTAYQFFMGQARLANAILDGSPKQPVSEYITCRA